MADPAVEHGWVSSDPTDGSEVVASNMNDHVIDYDLLYAGELADSEEFQSLAAASLIYASRNFR